MDEPTGALSPETPVSKPKKSRTSGAVWLAIAVFVGWISLKIVWFSLGLALDNAPGDAQSDQGGGEAPVVTREEIEADNRGYAREKHRSDVPVLASKISSDYESNELLGDRLYKDKWVVISGNVDSVSRDIPDSPYVAFEGPGIVGHVQCYLAPEYVDQATSLAKGKKAVLLGKVQGKFANILVKECMVMR